MSLIFIFYVAYIIIFIFQVLENLKSNNSIPLLALFMSMIAFVFSTGFTTISDIYKRHNDLRVEQFRKEEKERRNKEEEHRNKEEKNQYLRNSIDLFYIPLLNLLEKDNIDLITMVNGHRYLAQPRVRLLFESYLQTNKGKEKLLELTHRDLEFLQKELIKN